MPTWIFAGIAALILASVAGGFSIIGLGALYEGAFFAVIVMGIAIEIGKIATTFWLHKNYYKHKFVSMLAAIMVILAMSVTSGGVYGFLTKSHIEQATPIANKTLQIETLNKQIAASESRIKRADDTISLMDAALQVQISNDFASRAQKQRAAEKEQRLILNDVISDGYENISQLNDKLLILQQNVVGVEAKLGPIKYLSELMGLDSTKTVQYFTMVMALLLDPFAIILIIITGIMYDARTKKDDLVEVDEINKDIVDVVITNNDISSTENLNKEIIDVEDQPDIVDDETEDDVLSVNEKNAASNEGWIKSAGSPMTFSKT